MNTKNYPHECVFIIPTYTNTEGLAITLRLIEKFYPKYPTVVVNNGNRNIAKGGFVLLQEEKNVGFAKACNDGAKKARKIFKPSYLIFLNDDVSFNSDWVTQCTNTISQKMWVAASTLLKKEDGSIENCGYQVLPSGKIRLIKDSSSEERVDGISATALVFETKSFFQLGGFDERFFAYLEDVDLFLRAKRLGMKFGVANQAIIIHKGQETSKKMRTKKAWLDFRNWILVIHKNWSREELRRYWPQILLERGRNFWGIVKSLF